MIRIVVSPVLPPAVLDAFRPSSPARDVSRSPRQFYVNVKMREFRQNKKRSNTVYSSVRDLFYAVDVLLPGKSRNYVSKKSAKMDKARNARNIVVTSLAAKRAYSFWRVCE
jgi:hypothetical protein